MAKERIEKVKKARAKLSDAAKQAAADEAYLQANIRNQEKIQKAKRQEARAQKRAAKALAAEERYLKQNIRNQEKIHKAKRQARRAENAAYRQAKATDMTYKGADRFRRIGAAGGKVSGRVRRAVRDGMSLAEAQEKAGSRSKCAHGWASGSYGGFKCKGSA